MQALFKKKIKKQKIFIFSALCLPCVSLDVSLGHPSVNEFVSEIPARMSVCCCGDIFREFHTRK